MFISPLLCDSEVRVNRGKFCTNMEDRLLRILHNNVQRPWARFKGVFKTYKTRGVSSSSDVYSLSNVRLKRGRFSAQFRVKEWPNLKIENRKSTEAPYFQYARRPEYLHAKFGGIPSSPC